MLVMVLELIAPAGILTILLLSGSYLVQNEKNRRYLRASGYLLVTISLLLYIPYNIFEEQSIVESILSLIGVVFGLYVIRIVLDGESEFRHTTLMVLITSIILILAYSVGFVQSFLIESVANETSSILEFLGYETSVITESERTYIVFAETGLRTQIVLACTGIGSIAIFIGLAISSSKFSIGERIGLALFTSSVIYVLNIARNVFIASAYGGQWLHVAPNIISSIFGRGDEWVSYYVADRIIAQLASAVFLILFAIAILSYVDEDTSMMDEWVVLIGEIVDDLSRLKRKP